MDHGNASAGWEVVCRLPSLLNTFPSKRGVVALISLVSTAHLIWGNMLLYSG
jgi:hypothetical protein